MSLKTYWQRICQMIKKWKIMSQENNDFVEDNLESTQEELSMDNAQEAVETDELTALTEELAQQKDKNLRLFAEFENFRKRTNKERVELYKTANESLLADLLPVLDDFERAELEITKAEDEGLLEGVNLIRNKFTSILKSKGLTAIPTEAGDDFDLDKHEAVTQIPAPSEELKGKIVDVIETGYMLNDKVIRYTKVVVGK